jgi:hypothetical protein
MEVCQNAIVVPFDISVVVSTTFPVETNPERRRINSGTAETDGRNTITNAPYHGLSGDMEPGGMANGEAIAAALGLLDGAIESSGRADSAPDML